MPARRVLVVEDDAAIRRGIVDALRFQGFETFEASTFREALREAVHCACDLLLLDLVLPGGDGLEVLTEARAIRPTLPVIILTARGQEADRVKGLQLGADDYVVKPFSVKELLARVEAVLRRSAERPLGISELPLPSGTVDFRRLEVRFTDGTREELSEREVALMRYLAQNPNRAISREELFSRVWRLPSKLAKTRAIDMHIARLREKIRDNSEDRQIILTVRGKGYMLALPKAQ
jgi:DNA-binding response OmpR family regulator